MNRGAWWAMFIVHGVAESDATERLNCSSSSMHITEEHTCNLLKYSCVDVRTSVRVCVKHVNVSVQMCASMQVCVSV